jgi:hypothetical protein
MSTHSGHRQVISFFSALMRARLITPGYRALMVLFRNYQDLKIYLYFRNNPLDITGLYQLLKEILPKNTVSRATNWSTIFQDIGRHHAF